MFFKLGSTKMRRPLKIRIGHILIVMLMLGTLQWTLNSLRASSSSMSAHDEKDKANFGMVACGKDAMDQVIVLMKSIILSSVYYGGPKSLGVILFTPDNSRSSLDTRVAKLQNLAEIKGLNFSYEMHPTSFPADEWATLFEPCASQRLFFQTALPHIDKILYLDVDTLVTGDLRKVWGIFRKMRAEQAVALSPNRELSAKDKHGWYNNFTPHPFYPPLGLNSGVMLMSLEKLRNDLELRWGEGILSAYKTYRNTTENFWDQELINIVLHNRPEAAYVLPCSFNYRTDHCRNEWNCNISEAVGGSGIQILHGNRKAFLRGHLEPHSAVFRKVYKYFSQIDLSKEDYPNELIAPLRKELANVKKNESSLPNCDSARIGKLLFN